MFFTQVSLVDRTMCCMDKALAFDCGLSVAEYSSEGYNVSTDPKWDTLNHEISDSETAGEISNQQLLENFPYASDREVHLIQCFSMFTLCFRTTKTSFWTNQEETPIE